MSARLPRSHRSQGLTQLGCIQDVTERLDLGLDPGKLAIQAALLPRSVTKTLGENMECQNSVYVRLLRCETRLLRTVC